VALYDVFVTAKAAYDAINLRVEVLPPEGRILLIVQETIRTQALLTLI
jgi:hypothetical protein